MIVVVCLNPALDITHHVAAVEWGGVNRPGAVHDRPGGKGLNVARTLHALGCTMKDLQASIDLPAGMAEVERALQAGDGRAGLTSAA